MTMSLFPEFQCNKCLLSTYTPCWALLQALHSEVLCITPTSPTSRYYYLHFRKCGQDPVACMWGPGVESRFPKNRYHLKACKPTHSCTSGIIPPSFPGLPGLICRFSTLSHCLTSTTSSLRAGICLGPQPPAQGLEHSQPSGVVWQPAQADNPSHTQGGECLLRARLCPDCSHFPVNQEERCVHWLFLLLAPKAFS